MYSLLWVIINSCFLRFWKPFQSQMKCLTLYRSWAPSTPRYTEMARRPSPSLEWTPDPSLDHLHSSTQVQCWINFAKETLMTNQPSTLFFSMVRLIMVFKQNLSFIFFIGSWAAKPFTEAKNGRQVFISTTKSWCVGSSVLMSVACKFGVNCPCKHSTARCHVWFLASVM